MDEKAAPKNRDHPDRFLKAYHDFREQIDITRGGVLPEVDDLVCYMLIGFPRVPADDESGENSRMDAINQRVSIFKALFVEINKDSPEGFVDEGLRRYDQAALAAKTLLEEGNEDPPC
ncbi:MAG: hypothetical protein PHS17_03130 [Desulfobacterales bacterium]|nr:hypothetical protein [Desulfobacterales bacterium]